MMNQDPVALQRQMLMRLMQGQNLAGPTPMQPPQMAPPPQPPAPMPGQGAMPYQPPMQPMGGRRGR
jgi:hypothetical protein